MRNVLLLIAAFPIAAHAQPLPVFPAKNVPDTFFGTVVDDPYRALEDEKDPEVAAWMKAQADYARRTIESLPGYAELEKRIAELDNAAAARSGSIDRVRNGDLYYTRRGATENVFKLYVRRADGRESLLADPEDWQRETGKPHAINYFHVSPDSSKVAVGVSQGGNELATLYVIDTATRQRIGEPIDRARYSQVSWTEDSKAFFYTRGPVVAPDAPVSEVFKNRRTYFHVMGTKPDEDTLVLGPDANPRVKVVPTESPAVVVTPGSRYAIAVVSNGVQRELTLYAAPLDAARRADAPWKKICDASHQVTGFAVRGDDILLLSPKASPRFAVLKTALGAPDVARASVVVAPGELLIAGMAAARDALYYETREGAIKRLKRIAWDDARAQEVRFPIEGAVEILTASPQIDGVVAGLSAWTRAREIYAVDREGRSTNTGLQPLGRFDAPTDLVSTEVRVRSHDGAMVPLSIVHRKGIARDGSNPTLLIGYGSYGITFDATFDPVRIAWLEKGGVFAVANVRGSSAYGEDWYKAGYKATKPNTWKDFIACAEYLVTQEYTSSKHLGILGGSAGGITVGRALTERPDLFAAAIPQVGMLDFVRLQVMPIGPVNVVEFGDIRKEDEFRGLLAMSSYHHVQPGTAYPAVLLQHGVNDTRVNVGQSNKMAARLMASTTSGKPVLLDLDYDSGHGQGMTKAQRQHLIAHYYAFLLWQTK